MQVVLEPIEGRVRASSGAPLDIEVEASDEGEALAKMFAEVLRRLEHGARIVEMDLPQETGTLANPWLALHGIFTDDLSFDDWQADIREYRKAIDLEDGPW